MKNKSKLRLLIACLLAWVALSPVHAADIVTPEGLAVVPGPDGRNVVTVEIGDNHLVIDPAPEGSQETEHSIFVLQTAAGDPGPSRSMIQLLPDTRPHPTGQAAEPTITVRSGFTMGNGPRRVVIMNLGRCATAADTVVWLPQEKTLITGRISDRVGIAATFGSDTGAWAAAIRRLLDLEPEIVIPGRGAPGGAGLLTAQLERLTEIRAHVETQLMAGQSVTSAAEGFSPQWFSDWRKAAPSASSQAFEAVYDEIAGLTPPWELLEDRKLREGPSPTKNDPGWTKPRKILWRNHWPDRLPMLAQVARGVEIVPYDTVEEALAEIADADALIGTATSDLLAAGAKLRWVQVGSAGVERYLTIPQLKSGAVILSNGQRMASAMIGEHVMALTRALARGLNQAVEAQIAGEWRRSEIGNSAPLTGLRGKTMLVVGLGGIGTEVARLADGAGMRVTAIRNSRREGPPFVDKVGLAEDLSAFAAEADVVANCLPMTPATADTFNADLFSAMKNTAFFINVGRGGTVDTDALVAALTNGKIAGAGLDVTDPEPLVDGHPLWEAPNLIITPHFAAWSDEGRERRWLLYRENLRRFVAGERLLSVVDPDRGY